MALALILAGGRSERFGAEKALARLGDRTLLERTHEMLAAHCGEVCVSAPQGSETWAAARRLGLPCVEDPPGGPRGPLSGVLAGLRWAQGCGEVLLTAPCDAPLLPRDLAARLLVAVAGAPAALARTPRGLQPLCAAWRTLMIRPLEAALARGLHPPVHRVLTDAGAAIVDFPDDAAFLNVNTPDDLAEAARRLDGAAGDSSGPRP